MDFSLIFKGLTECLLNHQGLLYKAKIMTDISTINTDISTPPEALILDSLLKNLPVFPQRDTLLLFVLLKWSFALSLRLSVYLSIYLLQNSTGRKEGWSTSSSVTITLTNGLTLIQMLCKTKYLCLITNQRFKSSVKKQFNFWFSHKWYDLKGFSQCPWKKNLIDLCWRFLNRMYINRKQNLKWFPCDHRTDRYTLETQFI